MTVYFSASLSRYRKLLPLTKDIARIIADLGHEVTSKHVVKAETTKGEWEDRYEPHALFEREMRRLATSDVLITEATTPSFGAGFLIQTALSLGKPILTLHYGKKKSDAPLMLRGHRKLNLKIYDEETIRAILSDFFAEAEENVFAPLNDFDQ